MRLFFTSTSPFVRGTKLINSYPPYPYYKKRITSNVTKPASLMKLKDVCFIEYILDLCINPVELNQTY